MKVLFPYLKAVGPSASMIPYVEVKSFRCSSPLTFGGFASRCQEQGCAKIVGQCSYTTLPTGEMQETGHGVNTSEM